MDNVPLIYQTAEAVMLRLLPPKIWTVGHGERNGRFLNVSGTVAESPDEWLALDRRTLMRFNAANRPQRWTANTRKLNMVVSDYIAEIAARCDIRDAQVAFI